MESPVLEFTWLVTDGFMEEYRVAIRTPSPRIHEVTKKFEIFPGSSHKLQKNLAPNKKNIWGYGGVYTMENNDTNTDYHKFVRLGDQK